MWLNWKDKWGISLAKDVDDSSFKFWRYEIEAFCIHFAGWSLTLWATHNGFDHWLDHRFPNLDKWLTASQDLLEKHWDLL